MNVDLGRVGYLSWPHTNVCLLCMVLLHVGLLRQEGTPGTLAPLILQGHFLQCRQEAT